MKEGSSFEGRVFLQESFEEDPSFKEESSVAYKCAPKYVGRGEKNVLRLTGHKYLRNKLSHRDVSSCRFFL